MLPDQKQQEKKPKASPDQIRKRRIQVAQLYTRGNSQRVIARELGISQQLVCHDLQMIRAEWRKETIRDFGAAQERELAKIDNLEATYWKAWERSCQDKERIVIREIKAGKNPGTNEETHLEGQAGDPRFLDGVMKCISKRCEILGLNAPIKIEDTTPARVVEVLVEQREDVLTVQDLLASGRLAPSEN